jgi:hypothetical protein
MTNESENPTVDEIAIALFENDGKYIEFDYQPLFEYPMTPSRAAEMANTICREPLRRVKAFIGQREKGTPWLSSEGNWLITLRTMMRQDATTKEYKWRAYRMEGIQLETVFASMGSRGKERVFPNAGVRELVHVGSAVVGSAVI